jgi:hypothetical protein
MKTTFLLALCLFAFVATTLAAIESDDVRTQFIAFQRKYNKVYSSEEFPKRFSAFQASLARAAQSQQLNPRARFGVTKFSDLTAEEFRASYLLPKVRIVATTFIFISQLSGLVLVKLILKMAVDRKPLTLTSLCRVRSPATSLLRPRRSSTRPPARSPSRPTRPTSTGDRPDA